MTPRKSHLPFNIRLPPNLWPGLAISNRFANRSELFLSPRRAVAQIFNLLYRRIAFGWVPLRASVLKLATASGLQIRDTAECNSALLWLRCQPRSA